MIQSAAGIHPLPAPLPLTEGGLLQDARIAWEAVGSPAGDGTIVLLHDVSDSHRGLAEPEGRGWSPHGWARALCREALPEGAPLLFLNLLGSPFGSSSAAELPDFPLVSVEDMARAAAATLRGLSVGRARAIVGVGLGGQVALELASRFTDSCRGVIALGAPRVLPQGLREHLALTPQLLAAERGEGAGRALRKLRLELLRRHYGREHLSHAFEDAFAAERWLEEEAGQFARSFPAAAWASLARAWGAADLSDRLYEVRAHVLLVCAATDELAPPARVRDAYHALTAGGARTHLYELQGPGGHAGLTAEAVKLRGPVLEFLDGLR